MSWQQHCSDSTSFLIKHNKNSIITSILRALAPPPLPGLIELVTLSMMETCCCFRFTTTTLAMIRSCLTHQDLNCFWLQTPDPLTLALWPCGLHSVIVSSFHLAILNSKWCPDAPPGAWVRFPKKTKKNLGCFNVQLLQFMANQEYHIYSVYLHTHDLGVAVKIRHIRNGKELPLVVADANFDPNFQVRCR